ncbi:MAG TPA: hypothetical protein VHZ96_09490 [Frankiaceae bacterium]|jgi:uncharacterized membrane protein|nr:hypothetical protein [Frankiaceae bacterium]
MGTSKRNMTERGLLARSLALGLASGMRSSLGFAAPGLGSRRSEGLTAGSAVRLLGIGGELVVDKLPQTPSRLSPPGLAARFASGAAGALQLATRTPCSTKTRVTAVVIGVAGAAGGSYGGAAWRRTSAGGRPDWQGAVAEDAVAVSLAFAASR